jgi:AcrR family transcriptional regulator
MIDTDSKLRIQHAAHELVMKYSIRSVSMDDIAASVGMSKMTLYQYFHDKDALITAVVESVIGENQCACNGHSETAENAVHEMFLAMEMTIEMFQSMNPSIIYDMQKYHPEAYQKFNEHKTKFLLGYMQQNIERGIKEGLYRGEINAQIMSRFRIESMFIPFNPDFQRSLHHYNLLQIEEQIITHFLFGMVSAKGYKVAMKYMSEKESKNQPSK